MNYDAKKVTVVVDGVTITGFAEGSMVTFEPPSERSTATVSAKGEVARAVKNNPLGTATINLAQTSPSNVYLMQIANSDKEVSMWTYSDSDVKEKIGGAQAWITALPGAELGGEITTRAYAFQIADYTHTAN